MARILVNLIKSYSDENIHFYGGNEFRFDGLPGAIHCGTMAADQAK